MLTATFMSSTLSPPVWFKSKCIFSHNIFRFTLSSKGFTLHLYCRGLTPNSAVYNTVNICGKVCIGFSHSSSVSQGHAAPFNQALSCTGASSFEQGCNWKRICSGHGNALISSRVGCQRVRASHQGLCRLLPFAFVQGWRAMFTALKLCWIPYVSTPTCSWWQCKYAYANQVQCLPS